MSGQAEAESVVREWVSKAESDLLSAEHNLLLGDLAPTSIVCFHIQQAVEKYIKALLAYHGIDFPKTHDISYLLSILPGNSQNLCMDEVTTEKLSYFAVSGRYPGFDVEPTAEEAQDLLRKATAFKKAVRAVLPLSCLVPEKHCPQKNADEKEQ